MAPQTCHPPYDVTTLDALDAAAVVSVLGMEPQGLKGPKGRAAEMVVEVVKAWWNGFKFKEPRKKLPLEGWGHEERRQCFLGVSYALGEWQT